jgi:hypothetical protein
MILIASPYCLNELSVTNRCCFDEIHQISRDFHETDYHEIQEIIFFYIEKYGASNIRLLTNEDSAQLTYGRLREKYGIPGPKFDALLPFVNKVVCKERIKHTVKIPKFVHFDKQLYSNRTVLYLEELEAFLGFPMFAKPIDLVSSVETHFIPDMQHLKKIADRIFSHPYEFEIDEFIEGDLFHCDALIVDESVQFFMAGQCSFALSRFFEGKPVGSIPVEDESRLESLKNFSLKVFSALKCHSGAYHLEAFLEKKSGELIFLELGARTGGALITKVYERLFSLNIEEANYKIQMELTKKITFQPRYLSCGFLNFPKMNGVVTEIRKPSLNIESEFIEFVSRGEELAQAKNLLDISCSILFWDTSPSKVKEAFDFLKNYHPITLENHRITQCSALL